jgi:hypothetical protein
MADAAAMLARRFTLQATNPPFLGNRRQSADLKAALAQRFSLGKADLAGAMAMRLDGLCKDSGTIATVIKHEFFFQGSYAKLRSDWLKRQEFDAAIALGEHGFTSPDAAGAFSALLVVSRLDPRRNHAIYSMDLTSLTSPDSKALVLGRGEPILLKQSEQLKNPRQRIIPGIVSALSGPRLSEYCETYQGIKSGDDERFVRCFWEHRKIDDGWLWLQSTVELDQAYGGAALTIYWGQDGRHLVRRREEGQLAAKRMPGVAVSQMRQLPACILSCTAFDSNVSPVLVKNAEFLPAVFAFCSSEQYKA